MSKATHTNVEPKEERGMVSSYVTGFILSLALTAMPYYLVVNKIVSGNAMLATLLGFAILQVLVQVVFFLHLGRGPKPLYNIIFFVSTIGIILLVVGGSLFIMSHLHYNMTPSETTKQLAEGEAISQVEGKKTGACQVVKTNHRITITSGKANPAHSEAHLCDTLTFINEDSLVRGITFGTYPKLGTYAGQMVLTVQKKGNQTITLNQLGSYQFYDQLHPEVTGNFTVTQ